MLTIRFMQLDKKTAIPENKSFASTDEAIEACKAYAEPLGFTRFKLAEDGSDEGFRITATTPGGRAGRNIAHGDYDYDFT